MQCNGDLMRFIKFDRWDDGKIWGINIFVLKYRYFVDLRKWYQDWVPPEERTEYNTTDKNGWSNCWMCEEELDETLNMDLGIPMIYRRINPLIVNQNLIDELKEQLYPVFLFALGFICAFILFKLGVL